MNLKDVKVLMFDLDGTLIQNGKDIALDVLEALKELKSRGYILVINSGRPIFLTLKVLQSFGILELFSYLFGCNGTEIYDVAKAQKTTLAYLDEKCVYDVAYLFKDVAIAIALLTEEMVYIDKMIDPEIIDFYRRTRGLDVEVRDFKNLHMSTPKLLGFIEHPALKEILAKLETINDPRFDLFFSNRYLLEIVPKGYSKKAACRYLKKLASLNKENILSFGDEDNDLPMFEETVAVAMGNAEKHVQMFADFTTDSIDKTGICAFLQRYGFIAS